MIDIIQRRPYNHVNQRYGARTWGRRPRTAIAGPKVMLINSRSFSDGEATPAAFHTLKLGTLVGTPTAGGAIWTGSYALINGASIRTPGSLAVTWDPTKPNNYGTNLENYGVPPDVWVVNTPWTSCAATTASSRRRATRPCGSFALESISTLLRTDDVARNHPPTGGPHVGSTAELRGLALLTVALLPSPAIAAVNGRPVEFAAVITGRITDKETGQPVVAAQVAVTGSTRVGAISDNSGNYTLRGAPAGQVTLRVTRIGYQPVEQSVTVPANGSVTADFSLAHAVTRLADVVTTATGEQSRREVGNVVASVSLDSVVGAAPITNVSEMSPRERRGLRSLRTRASSAPLQSCAFAARHRSP